MDKIKHGLTPVTNRLFLLPLSYVKPDFHSPDPAYVRPVQKFEDPKTNEIFYGRIQGVVTLTIKELESVQWFSFMSNYKLTPRQTSQALQHRYKEIFETQQLRAAYVEILSDYQPEND